MTEKSAGADNSTGRKPVRSAAQRSRLYLDALRAADVAGAYRIAAEGLAEGMSLPELYQRVVAPAMHEIGALWEKGALTVADEHLATALTHRVLASLRPPIRADVSSERPGGPAASKRVMLAAVEGEQHALGLRMAADVFEDAGFEVIYLGADVPTEALLQAVASLSPDLLALSATMPELAPQLEEIAVIVNQAHPRPDLLIGGQAASPRFDGETLVQDLEILPERLTR